MILLETKMYPIKELATLLDIKITTNVSREVQKHLDKMGYQYTVGHGKIIITEVPQKIYEDNYAEVVRIMKQMFPDTKMPDQSLADFAIMVYLIKDNKEFRSSPWFKRKQILELHYNIHRSESTLYNWLKRLDNNNLLNKSKDKTVIWKTTVNKQGHKVRSRVITEAEMDKAKKWFNRKAMKLDNEGRENFKCAMISLWNDTKEYYYIPSEYFPSAFSDSVDKELLDNLYKATEKYAAEIFKP